MNDIKALLERRISCERAKDLLVALVKVPSPQTELLEDEPLLKVFITSAIEPRLRTMGFSDICYNPMSNLIATYGAGASGKSLMLIGNAMNQPAATMPNPYAGDVVDGATYGLPGECVMGKGASEQKANLAAMLHAMEAVIASKTPINGKLIFTCCVSGETGKHDAIKSVVEGAGVRADMAVLGGTGLKITLGNRGRIDVFVTVKGSPCHSSRPWDGVNAIPGPRRMAGRALHRDEHVDAAAVAEGDLETGAAQHRHIGAHARALDHALDGVVLSGLARHATGEDELAVDWNLARDHGFHGVQHRREICLLFARSLPHHAFAREAVCRAVHHIAIVGIGHGRGRLVHGVADQHQRFAAR